MAYSRFKSSGRFHPSVFLQRDATPTGLRLNCPYIWSWQISKLVKERVILREGILLEGREHSWWEEMEEEFAAIHAANSWDLLYRVGQESQHRLPI